MSLFGSGAELARTLGLVVKLANGVQEAYPREIPDGLAFGAAVHAVQQATDDHPPGEILFIGARESRLRNHSKPQCGVMQVHIEGKCHRDLQTGFELGVARLEEWDRLCDRMKVKDHDGCVHAGFARGTKAAKKQVQKWKRNVRRGQRIVEGGKR